MHGRLDWTRRHQLMRTHTALHILCGVIWADYAHPGHRRQHGAAEGTPRLPVPLDVGRLGAKVEKRINDEIEKAHEILVDFVPRSLADVDRR